MESLTTDLTNQYTTATLVVSFRFRPRTRLCTHPLGSRGRGGRGRGGRGRRGRGRGRGRGGMRRLRYDDFDEDDMEYGETSRKRKRTVSHHLTRT